ncbi:MAG: uS17 family ribosomal protein [bacterium]
MNNNLDKKIRRFEGVVVSIKMKDTVKVAVERTVLHPLYGKRYVITKQYLCQPMVADLKEGDKVTIAADRPRSKQKKWAVIAKLK